MRTPMPPVGDLALNLRLLCGTWKSVSEVCRRIGINRQQFGRYLSGACRPSRFNMARICDFFGVTASDLDLPTAEFESRFSDASRGLGGGGWLGSFVEQTFPADEQNLRNYLGFYHAYFHSFGWSGLVMRTLVCFFEHRGRVLSKTIERMKDPVHGARFIFKYDGVVTMRGDRLFIVDVESLGQEDIGLTVLYRTYRSHVTHLTGLTMGASSRPGRDPAAARIVFQFLGRTIDYWVALRSCGLFSPNARELDPRLISMIANDPAEEEPVLLGRTDRA